MHQSSNKTFIKEIFTSLQGEGPYVGQKQIFVRFCKCNLRCDFCDTDFDFKQAKEYSAFDLYNQLNLIPVDVVSFTGGEPLLEFEFLKELFSKYNLNKKIYLETNGTCYLELEKIIDYIDIVAMDIKLKSATGEKNRFLDNEKFLSVANKKEVFSKVVFDKNIEENEIDSVIDIVKKHNTPLILQPKMPMDSDLYIEKIFDKFYSKYKNTRLIPQVHKFLNII